METINNSRPVEPVKKPGLTALLKNRNFRLLWLGQVVSDFGDGLTNLALLVLINKLTGSTVALATMLIVLLIPKITFGLIAGVYVDRLDRRQIMISSDLVRGVLVLGFVLGSSAGQIWVLYVIGFLQACVGTLFVPAKGALLPNLVAPANLLAANSASQTGMVIFSQLGTAAGGVLVSFGDTYWPAFTLDAFTFFWSAAMVSRIKVPAASAVATNPTDTNVQVQRVFRQLLDGLKLIGHSRLLLGTLVAVSFALLGLGSIEILLIRLLVNELHVEAAWLGGLVPAQIIATILSGSFVVVLAVRFKPTSIVSVGMVVLSLSIGMYALANSLWQLFLLIFLIGFLLTPINASIPTIIQSAVTDKVRGRVGSTFGTVTAVAQLISLTLAGVLADSIGVRLTFGLVALCTAGAGLASGFLFRDTSS